MWDARPEAGARFDRSKPIYLIFIQFTPKVPKVAQNLSIGSISVLSVFDAKKRTLVVGIVLCMLAEVRTRVAHAHRHRNHWMRGEDNVEPQAMLVMDDGREVKAVRDKVKLQKLEFLCCANAIESLL